MLREIQRDVLQALRAHGPLTERQIAAALDRHVGRSVRALLRRALIARRYHRLRLTQAGRRELA